MLAAKLRKLEFTRSPMIPVLGLQEDCSTMADSDLSASSRSDKLPAKELPGPPEGNLSGFGGQAIAILVAHKETLLWLRLKPVQSIQDRTRCGLAIGTGDGIALYRAFRVVRAQITGIHRHREGIEQCPVGGVGLRFGLVAKGHPALVGDDHDTPS